MKVDYGLYYVLDLPSERNPLELARQAVAGGASVLQLRGKHSDATELYRLANALKPVLAPSAVPLVINDRLDVALAADADGVHVGAEDLPPEQVRAVAPHLLLGVSCYGDLERARAAAQAGADYVAFGSFFLSPSKPDAEIVPLSMLSEARALGLPVVAIGGITEENAHEVLDAGADGIAVISAIQHSPDPEAAARVLRELVDRRQIRA
ncbi:MAG: thiamine phosphate synthase [Chloroflexota bacterium]|nr:thiamine phosphate synthase [Chloroflexota bacterium]